jgi:hypothetical protein
VNEMPSVVKMVSVERSRVSITEFFRKRFPALFGTSRIRAVATPTDVAVEPSKPRILCIGRIYRGRMTTVTAFPRKGACGDGKQIHKDQGAL